MEDETVRNKYAGICYRCGETVEAGAGHFERNYQSRGWRVQHTECAIKYRGTDHGKEGATEHRERYIRRRLEQKALGTGKPARRARAKLKALAADGTPIISEAQALQETGDERD